MARRPRAFLRYSSEDEDFVRDLARSLTLCRVVTCVERRDIDAGNGDHVIYIVSGGSRDDAWFREDLEGTMRARIVASGARVHCIVIGKAALPSTLPVAQHIVFRDRRDPADYRRATLELLSSMEVEPYRTDDAEIGWFVLNENSIRYALRDFATVSAEMYGAMHGWHIFGTAISTCTNRAGTCGDTIARTTTRSGPWPATSNRWSRP